MSHTTDLSRCSFISHFFLMISALRKIALYPGMYGEYDFSCLQIYVEIERARLTRKLALMKEDEGKIKEAAEILQEVAVVRSCHAFLC